MRISPLHHLCAGKRTTWACNAAGEYAFWPRGFPMTDAVHPVDEVLPLPKLFALGLQHVLVMYANAVAVPLILGGALHLPKDQIAMLINADLFACGIATLIQPVGFGRFGIRLPMIMGVTAVAISPMLARAGMSGGGRSG